MNFLPKIEEILLLAIWKLDENAYGTTIIEQVEKDTGSSWVSGSVYSALARLKNNGSIRTVKIEKSSDGIGRPRIYYELTAAGRQKLMSAQKVTQSIWEGVPNLDKGF
ncbi:PadR family transcriptional regulator [candidate division KSB1 bacterium]